MSEKFEHPATAQSAHPDWLLPWEPPQYRVDANGKVAGASPRDPNNWGRWGDLDQIGTLNLITDEVRAYAARLVRTGQIVSCCARMLSSHLLTDRVAGRGVLLDVARLRGVTRLDPGDAITAAELDACATVQGVDLRSGDIVLVRTGEMGYFYTTPPESRPDFFTEGHPGLALDTVEWLHEHDIAALGMDNRTIEVVPWPETDGPAYPIHNRLIRDLGLTIGELWWLDHLAAACVEHDRWEFLLVATPLPVRGPSGVPTSPVAFF